MRGWHYWLIHYIFSIDNDKLYCIYIMTIILKGLLGFILKPSRNGSGEIWKKVHTNKELGPWPFRTLIWSLASFCMNLYKPNWPNMDNWWQVNRIWIKRTVSRLRRSAFIAEFAAMEALRGVFRGVFRGVCNRLLFCWAFLRRQNMWSPPSLQLALHKPPHHFLVFFSSPVCLLQFTQDHVARTGEVDPTLFFWRFCGIYVWGMSIPHEGSPTIWYILAGSW